MVAVVDYNAGNVRSVLCALDRLGAKAELTSERSRILSADHVIFPGVGSAASAMKELERRDLISTLREVRKPFLGICLGMQLMNAFSEEGDVPLLSFFESSVLKFPSKMGYKIPHVGWNDISCKEDPLFEGLGRSEYMYFVHSYYMPLLDDVTIACTEYDGLSFTAAVHKGNLYGCQFHPEKSGKAGERILSNFLKMEVLC